MSFGIRFDSIDAIGRLAELLNGEFGGGGMTRCSRKRESVELQGSYRPRSLAAFSYTTATECAIIFEEELTQRHQDTKKRGKEGDEFTRRDGILNPLKWMEAE